jgi:restriction system protein
LKLKMAKNSLFAVLLRSPWWVSALVALVLTLLSVALLPAEYRAVGVVSGLPFVVIAAIAARRQWELPSAARVAETGQAVAAMDWPTFSHLLEQAFRRDGFEVQRSQSEAYDFELSKDGKRMLVCARRWKAARTGLEALRALQAARTAADVSSALYIGLGSVSENGLPFAAKQQITIWRLDELAFALRGLPLTTGKGR